MRTRWREFLTRKILTRKILAGTGLAGAGLAGAGLDGLAAPALAAPAGSEAGTAAAFAIAVGALAFAGGAGFLHAAGRRAARRREAELSAEAAALRARLREAEFFLDETSQALMVLPGPGEAARIAGDLSILGPGEACGREQAGSAPPAFTDWLAAEDAARLAGKAERLRAEGEAFRLTLRTLDGRWLEVEGAPRDGRALLRLRDVSHDRLEAIGHESMAAEAHAQLHALWATFEASPNPAWLRDREGRLALVNAAYAGAVEAKDPADAVTRGLELLEKPSREASLAARAAGEVWRARAPAVAVGERRIFEVVDAPAKDGGLACAGMAADVTELQGARDALEREREAHARTLDQLSTAVAIFDGARRLAFHNAAYRQLWGLDHAWLDERPTDGEILDRLRAAELLPMEADYRAWKEKLLSSYQALETEEQPWHLPDGRTLRMVANPSPQGGVTYLYDDLTERFRLESRFNAAMRVQSETLDALSEGVAVFGSDGRLKLFNPAFAELWSLDPAQLGGEPHIDRVAELCAPLFAQADDWSALKAAVAGLEDQRQGSKIRKTLRDARVFDCAAAPLPDGATLLTFIDATDGVKAAQALTERNQALVEAERLRNDFVHHVSYELRSPLTNIIGFAQRLDDPAVGPLNALQREYVGYVNAESTSLLAIINDILDLASIDVDAMELSLEEIDVAGAAFAAAEAMKSRAADSGVSIHVLALEPLGAFVADGKRLRQILTNLLSNAIGFSNPGEGIDLVALRRDGEIAFKVIDRGRGVPPEVIDHIFDRFRTHSAGSRHRGVGLGLSIARSFVELHGGRILIDSAPGEGTTVTCVFPAKAAPAESCEREERERNG